ncbi:MAG: VWA domain-containing protein [candidate division WOR-3 bacterium]|nr:VWA domain-containing protein [candidate division WOR-3 bacterium]
MIKWANPGYLYLLLVVPVMFTGFILLYLHKKRILKKFADHQLIPILIERFNQRIFWIKSILFLLGVAFLVISLARPKWGEKLQIYKGKGIDIVIALDASKSMYAQDIKPSRLEKAKQDISYLLDNLGTHQVGITAFAGDCYVMCPLTTDIDAAKLFLDIIEPSMMPRPGTNIARAIEVSSSLFNPKEETHKALILFTDGENLEGDPMPALERAIEQGVRVFTVGIGTPEGSPIPESSAGGVVYKKDKDGNIVITRMADRLLLLIAKLSNGRFFRTEGPYIEKLIDELEAIKKKEFGGGEYVQFEERYQYFLVISFGLFFLSIFLSERKGKWV